MFDPPAGARHVSSDQADFDGRHRGGNVHVRQSISRRALGCAALGITTSFAILRHARGDAPFQLRCSLDTAPSHPRNVAFREFLAKIENASGGQIKTKLFESGALFPDLHVVNALVQGQVEMCCPGTWTITGFVPDGDFSQLPLFYGLPVAQVHKATDGSGGRFVNQEIADKLHVQVLGSWFDLGFNNWFSTRKPLKTLADLSGMKLRSPGGVLNSWRIRFFGGVPNVTAWPDVPLALSQGTFDGLISTNESTNSAKLYDSGMHHSLQDDQGMGLYVPLVNQTFWGKLGSKLQEKILGLWSVNLPTWRENTAKAQEHGRAELAKYGVTFVDVPPAVRTAARAKMLKQQDQAVADAHISPKLVKLVTADVGV
jgi:TRAP-type C4-dicarboxylate transport system substrate-binding protein